MVPFHQLRPETGTQGRQIAGHIGVPMDDENTMVFNWIYCVWGEPLTEDERLEVGSGNQPPDVDPDNGFRSRANKDNNYLLDRNVQRTDTFTGIGPINVQDRAIQESMGLVVDRRKEHLGPADKAIELAGSSWKPSGLSRTVALHPA